MQQLFGYRDEYSQKLLDTESGNLSAQRLRDHQSFVAKLGQTIDQVYIDIDKKKQHCEEQRQAWLQCRARSHALNSVVEKYQQQEFNEQEKREQKEQDEYASRISTRKP